MGRNLSLLARLPRFEKDEVTHRRDCECVRCDAGFRPSEQERAAARRRFDEGRVRERADRVVARRRERARLEEAELAGYLDEQVRAADEQVRALREAGERAREDGRLEELWSLRRAGLTLGQALERLEAPPPANDQGGRRR